MKVVTPPLTFQRLNCRVLGAYVLAEAFTQDFLYDNYGTKEGTIWEGNCADISESLELDYGDESDSNLLGQVVWACRKPDVEARFDAISALVDANKLSAFIAAEVFCNSWDGYSSHLSNYRVCYSPQTSRLSLVPNAVDIAFNDPRGAALPKFNGTLAQAFVETPKGRELYLTKLRRLCNNVAAADSLRRALEFYSTYARRALVLYEPSALPSQEDNARKITERIRERVQLLRHELECSQTNSLASNSHK